jgi:alpha-tubulin suppressor-like RCC1 family protein/Flp pilus assembly pilin Flp
MAIFGERRQARILAAARRHERGASGFTYGLIVGLVAVVGILAVSNVGTAVSDLLGGTDVAISDPVDALSNHAPEITGIADQSTTAGGTIGPLAFTVSDPDGGESSLTVTAVSSNQSAVPDANIALGGSGSSRSITLTSAGLGTSVITVTVSDAYVSAVTSFTVQVLPGLVAWGQGNTYQLGDNGGVSRTLPVTAKDSTGTSVFTGATQVAMGHETAYALTGGGVQAWGWNGCGQIGDGTTLDRHLPATVLNEAGSAPLSGVSEITTTYCTACARVGGQALCWGSGALGSNPSGYSSSSNLPKTVRNSTDTGPLTGISQIAGGENYVCALISGGVWCWGINSHGQLGVNDTTARALPTQVKDAAGTGTLSGVSEIAVGSEHTCALISGNVWCWGYNAQGQLGNSATFNNTTGVWLPVQAGITGAEHIEAGDYHTCVIKTGNIWCWGSTQRGQLGNGQDQFNAGNRYTAAQVRDPAGTGFLTDIAEVGLAATFSCARSTDGHVWCWGQNVYGAIGNGATTCGTGTGIYANNDCPFPVPVKDSAGTGLLTGVTGLGRGSTSNFMMAIK